MENNPVINLPLCASDLQLAVDALREKGNAMLARAWENRNGNENYSELCFDLGHQYLAVADHIDFLIPE